MTEIRLYYTSNETIDLLRKKFSDRLISRRGCDFFLWGHVKEMAYANSPASIQDLKDGIRKAIENFNGNFD